MRPDLLDAQAAVDWAIAQIPILAARIERWRKGRPYLTVTEPDSQPGKEVVKVALREPLPREVNAEAGAIINMIRSSLDILVVALAERNGSVRPKDVYFPVASSVGEFLDTIHGAIKKIHRLSDADKLTIQNLKPYGGGDERLWSLHQLDILRKHQRLIGVTAKPRSFGFFGTAGKTPEFLYSGELKDGAPLVRYPAGTRAQTDIRLEVTFSETAFANGRPVTATLREFAELTNGVIRLFDV